MGELDKPFLPSFLYRYRPLSDSNLDRELRALEEQYLWCSVYKAMNDPMEGFYEPSARFKNETVFNRTVNKILEMKRQIGICSLSDTHENELMWAHYASNYAGMCVGYRAQQLVDGLPPDAHLTRLSYGAKPPDIGSHDAVDTRTAALKILSHKKSSWVYEREWRVLADQGRVNISAKACVRQLYLGSKIRPHHRSEILTRLAESPIAIFEMRVSNYVHEFSQVKTVKPKSKGGMVRG